MMILANVGTPLMWASMLWLSFGNLIIGLVEGHVIVKMTKAEGVKPYLLMIAANYFSAWVGLWCTVELQPWLDGWLTVKTLLPGLAALMFVAWAWSVVLEFPFVWFSIPTELRRSRWLPWRASLVAQTVSYAGLVLWLGSCSSMTLVTSTKSASVTEVAAGRGATVYYLTPSGDELRRIRLDGAGDAFVSHCERKSTSVYGMETLLVRKGDLGHFVVFKGAESVPLARLEPGPWLPIYESLSADVSFHAVALPGSEGYEVEAGFWPLEGLAITRLGETKRLSVEMPCAFWYVKSPTVMANGLVVFESGNQLLVYDAPTNRLALLTRGRLPLVIPDEAPPVGFKWPDRK